MVPIGESWAWMPALVGCVDDGSVVVGEGAFEIEDNQVVRSIKRFITEGRAFVQLDTPTGVRDIRADDLIVHMLRETARRASAQGLDVGGQATLLGCPAMWDGPQRRRLHDLARRAGLEVTLADLIDEPVAAGLAWLSEREWPDSTAIRVVVFDMGGGTLDSAVLEVSGGEVSVLAALGVPEAGNALDRAIAEDLELRLAAAGVNVGSLQRPRRARARLHYTGQDAKVTLTSVPRVDVKLPRSQFGIASIPYGRAELNEVFKEQMDRAELLVETVLRVASLPDAEGVGAHDVARLPVEPLTEKVDFVVLSGGMSQVPYVTERLRRLFPASTRIELARPEPDTAVAVGLAQAAGRRRIVSKHRPAFDVVLEWDEGRHRRVVYEAFTPLLEMRQVIEGSSELRFVRTCRDLKLPERGAGRLRVVSHSGEPVQAIVDGSDLDGFKVAWSEGQFEFSLYPNGRIRLTDGTGDYDGRLNGWHAPTQVPRQQSGAKQKPATQPR